MRRDRDGRRAAARNPPRGALAPPTWPSTCRVRCSSPALACHDPRPASTRVRRSCLRAGGVMRVLGTLDQFLDRTEIRRRIECCRDLLLREVAAHLGIGTYD